MCIVIKSRPEFRMGHVGSKTRSLGQCLEKPCVLSRRHSFDPVFMKLCQNNFLTLNKRLSRRAMLSDDSSCSSLQLGIFSPNWGKSHLDSIGKGAEYRPLRAPQKIPDGSQHMLLLRYKKHALNYPQNPLLSGALNFCHESS